VRGPVSGEIKAFWNLLRVVGHLDVVVDDDIGEDCLDFVDSKETAGTA